MQMQDEKLDKYTVFKQLHKYTPNSIKVYKSKYKYKY